MELALVHELPLDLEQSGLAVVDEHEPGRSDAGDLAAELRSDRATCAGHEHDLPGDVAGDRVEIRLHRLPAEQVLDLDRSDLTGEAELAGDQLVQARKRLDRNPLCPRDLDDTLTNVPCRGRDRDEELVGATVAQKLRKIFGRPEDAHAVQTEVLLARVVVDEPDRCVPERRVAQRLAEDELGGVSRPHDKHLPAACDERARGRPLDERAREQPDAHDECEQEEQVDDPDPARHLRGMKSKQGEDQEREGDGDHHPAENVPHIPQGYVAPPAVVEAEGDEDGEHEPHHEDDDVPIEIAVVVARPMVEADVPGEDPGSSDQARVDHDLP